MPKVRRNVRTWIRNLRSNRFLQGRNALVHVRSDNTLEHCCLGVACENAGIVSTNFLAGETPLYAGSNSFLPVEVMEWLGVTQSNPYVVIDDEYYRLASLNDTASLSFSQIADVIESQGYDWNGSLPDEYRCRECDEPTCFQNIPMGDPHQLRRKYEN